MNWIIDNRTTYRGQHGLGQKPLQLGAVVAECPTAFGTHTIRDTSTIGKPCPSKEELDAIGLRNAHLCKAAPALLSELSALVALCRGWIDDTEDVYPAGLQNAVARADAAIASAEGRDAREETEAGA